MNEKYLVSIVVPVHNVEKYITRCLDSIIAQTFDKVKIIIVENGSTDSSPEICKMYASKHEFIDYYIIQRVGISEARNFGISKVDTEYVMFIDSDDVVSDRFVEILYNAITKNKCDIVECDYVRFANNAQVEFDVNISRQLILNRKNAIRRLITNEHTDYLWNKIYKTKMLKDLKFIPNRFYEDIAIMHNVFQRAKKVMYIDAKLYGYYANPTSITNTHDDKKREDVLLCWIERYEFCKRKYPHLKKRCLKKIFYYYINIFDYGLVYNDNLKRANKYIKAYYNKRKYADLTKKDRLKILTARIAPRVYILKNKKVKG